MKDLERKIAKLEQFRDSKSSIDEDALWDYFESENIHPLERIGILIDLGLMERKTLIDLIIEANQTKIEKE